MQRRRLRAEKGERAIPKTENSLSVVSQRTYGRLVAACEEDLDRYGDSCLGVGWTGSEADAEKVYRTMLEVIKEDRAEPVTLLDFGCGASHLKEYLTQAGLTHIRYSGLDLSEKFLEVSRRKFPSTTYYHLDILDRDKALPRFDYIVMAGVFTFKDGLSFDEMFSYFRAVVTRVFAKANRGIAFNVMSKHVDWERDDLFHLPVEPLTTFVAKALSREFVVRHDYGLYQYTTYVYR
jgi:SAM-dependent methyltransferase